MKNGVLGIAENSKKCQMKKENRDKTGVFKGSCNSKKYGRYASIKNMPRRAPIAQSS